MENVAMGNATYLVSRVFVGNSNVSELIQKRIESNTPHLFHLTSATSSSYNDDGGSADLRRNHAN